MKIKSKKITLLEQEAVLRIAMSLVKASVENKGLCYYLYTALVSYSNATGNIKQPWKITHTNLGEFIPQFNLKTAKKYAKQHHYEIPLASLDESTFSSWYWWPVDDKLSRLAYLHQMMVRVTILITIGDLWENVKSDVKETITKLTKSV